MKIAVVYFTGTGSTACFADHIAKNLRNMNHIVHQFRMEKVTQTQLSEYDLIGFGCPTYSYRSPRIVSKLLTQIVIPLKPYFLFLTCGGQPGNTFWSMYKIIHRHAGGLMGTLRANGPNNIRSWRPKISKPPVIGDGLNEEDINNLPQKIQEILDNYQQIIIEKTKQPLKLYPNPINSLFSVFFSHDWEMARGLVGKKFIDSMLCTHCGLCVSRICPSSSISLDDNKTPVFNEKKCVGCNGCVNLCPVLAIWSKKTRDKQPYLTYKNYILNPPQ